jgi:hypothetical protein
MGEGARDGSDADTESSMKTIATGLAGMFFVLPLSVQAQAIRDCNTWEANARHVMMPPEVAVRSFAEGGIRVIGLDTAEPACCSAHLMVEYQLPDEPFPHCALVSATEGQGFSGLLMAELAASYDPARGLVLTLPAGRYDGMGSVMSPLVVVIDRATPAVTARHD